VSGVDYKVYDVWIGPNNLDQDCDDLAEIAHATSEWFGTAQLDWAVEKLNIKHCVVNVEYLGSEFVKVMYCLKDHLENVNVGSEFEFFGHYTTSSGNVFEIDRLLYNGPDCQVQLYMVLVLDNDEKPEYWLADDDIYHEEHPDWSEDDDC
jgi:hypothetical protein